MYYGILITFHTYWAFILSVLNCLLSLLSIFILFNFFLMIVYFCTNFFCFFLIQNLSFDYYLYLWSNIFLMHWNSTTCLYSTYDWRSNLFILAFLAPKYHKILSIMAKLTYCLDIGVLQITFSLLSSGNLTPPNWKASPHCVQNFKPWEAERDCKEQKYIPLLVFLSNLSKYTFCSPCLGLSKGNAPL